MAFRPFHFDTSHPKNIFLVIGTSDAVIFMAQKVVLPDFL